MLKFMAWSNGFCSGCLVIAIGTSIQSNAWLGTLILSAIFGVLIIGTGIILITGKEIA